MTTLETTQAVPLTMWEDGSIRLAGSRVTLDSIVCQFNLGATPEQIADSFQPLELADIYAVIAYYLTHRTEIEEYLLKRESEGDAMQTLLESDPQYQAIDFKKNNLTGLTGLTGWIREQSPKCARFSVRYLVHPVNLVYFFFLNAIPRLRCASVCWLNRNT